MDISDFLLRETFVQLHLALFGNDEKYVESVTGDTLDGLSGSGKNHGMIQYFKEELDVDANSIIYTSGSGGIFKSGIPIGKLKKFKEINNEVEFFSNLSQLNFVTLVSFDKGENK